MYDATEFMNEQLLTEPGDCVIVLGWRVQSVRVITCSPEPAENRIDFRPATLQHSNIQIDQPFGFGVQRVVYVDQHLLPGFNDDDAVLSRCSNESDLRILINGI